MTTLEVENIHLKFGGITALMNVSFKVNHGEIFSIMGPNGSGKTTILNILSRFYDPDFGLIKFFEKNINALSPNEIANIGIARTFQNVELLNNSSVFENLLLGRYRFRKSNLFEDLLNFKKNKKFEDLDKQKVEEMILFLKIKKYRDKNIEELPFGIKKIVELGRALCLEPKLLLLDEPSSGLNKKETDEMALWINEIKKNLNISIVMVEHNMHLASQISDKILVLNEGEIIAIGKPDEIESNLEVRRAYLGLD